MQAGFDAYHLDERHQNHVASGRALARPLGKKTTPYRRPSDARLVDPAGESGTGNAERGPGLIRFTTFSVLRRCTRFVWAALQGMNRDASDPARSGSERWRKPLVDSDRVLVSRTHVWLRAIPVPLQPKQLCRHFPRVANLIAANWNDRVLTDRVLNELIADRRGNRAGFPPRVNAELHALMRLSLRRTDKPGSLERRWRERKGPRP